MTQRRLARIIPAVQAVDGGGVRLRRSLGQSGQYRLDPFLMLDEISSDDPADYIAGFPAHPHRGFETVTYLLEGHMLHEDHLGHKGDLKSGGVQWMSAGRGIVHSEIPQQENGRLHGFQLWINLPSGEKMKAPSYRDIPAEEIPHFKFDDGSIAKLIAGALNLNGKPLIGAIQGLTTAPLFVDIRLAAQGRISLPLPPQHNAFIYPYVGEVVLDDDVTQSVPAHQAGILTAGDQLHLRAGATDTAFLLLAGQPIGEPIAQYGPFVMNTQAEIEQAIADYRSGEFTRSN